MQDFAEAIAQLAMFPPGREALLHDQTVLPALQQLAVEGWSETARHHAQAALAALSDRRSDEDRIGLGHDQRHVMLSYQWSYQEVVKRIVNELQVRGYRTWFGAHNTSLACSFGSCRRSFVVAFDPCARL